MPPGKLYREKGIIVLIFEQHEGLYGFEKHLLPLDKPEKLFFGEIEKIWQAAVKRGVII